MPTVLVVDDDPTTLDFVRRVLEAEGHTVRTTTSAAAALDICEREAVDLVLLEMMLPDKDGVEMIMEMRGRCPDRPVVAMSRGGVHFSAALALAIAREAGAVRGLRKPFSGSDLVMALDLSPPAPA